MKQLNKAFLEMSRNPENNDARLNYYGVLADTNLFLLLEQEPSNEILEPKFIQLEGCLLYTSPSPRDLSTSRMPSSA